MDEFEHLTDLEVLNRLRLEYLQALQTQDFSRIKNVVEPRFWARFARHYEQFGKGWKSIASGNTPTFVVLNPSRQHEMDLDWMDQVLKGQIEILHWGDH